MNIHMVPFSAARPFSSKPIFPTSHNSFIQSHQLLQFNVPLFLHNWEKPSIKVIQPLALNTTENCNTAIDQEEEKEDGALTVSAAPVRIVALVGDGSISPLKSTPWFDVMLHTVNNFSHYLMILAAILVVSIVKRLEKN